MQNQSFMKTMSHIIIFVPIVILAISLFLYTPQKSKSSSNSNVPTVPESQEQASATKQQAVATPAKSSSSSINLDLKGPYACSYSSEEISVEASIKDRQVFASINQNNETNNILVKGDCGYRWKEGEFTGDKMCSIGQYLSLFEMFASMSLLDVNSLFSMVSEIQPSAGSIDQSVIDSVADSCKEQEVTDDIFTVPANITFQESAVTPPTNLP